MFNVPGPVVSAINMVIAILGLVLHFVKPTDPPAGGN